MLSATDGNVINKLNVKIKLATDHLAADHQDIMPSERHVDIMVVSIQQRLPQHHYVAISAFALI